MFNNLNLEKILQEKKLQGYNVNIIIEKSKSLSVWDEDLLLFISSKFNFFFLKDFTLFIDNDCKNKTDINNLNSSQKNLNLLITDCISENWSTLLGYDFLNEISKKSFFSILNVLPQRMWKRTILDNTWRIKLTHTNNSELVSDIDEEECGVTSHIKVPMITLDNISMKHWSNLIDGEKDCWVYGSLFERREFLGKKLDYLKDNEEYSAIEEVRNFECASPPIVQKLAIYLSAIPLTFDSMRYVQRNILEDGKTVHLAEFFLSGLLFKTKEGYDFIEGVREILDNKLYPHARDSIKKKVSLASL